MAVPYKNLQVLFQLKHRVHSFVLKALERPAYRIGIERTAYGAFMGYALFSYRHEPCRLQRIRCPASTKSTYAPANWQRRPGRRFLLHCHSGPGHRRGDRHFANLSRGMHSRNTNLPRRWKMCWSLNTRHFLCCRVQVLWSKRPFGFLPNSRKPTPPPRA